MRRSRDRRDGLKQKLIIKYKKYKINSQNIYPTNYVTRIEKSFKIIYQLFSRRRDDDATDYSKKKTTCWIVCLSLLMILCKRMFRTSVYESKIIYKNIYILNALSGVIVFFSLLFDWHMKFWIKTILSWGVIVRCCTTYAKYHVWVTLKYFFFKTKQIFI